MDREKEGYIFCKILKPYEKKNPSAKGPIKIYSIIHVNLVRFSPYCAVTSLDTNYKGSSVCARIWVSVTALWRMRMDILSF